MSAQDLLTLLFNVIALSFITVATLDFITGLIPLMPRPKIPLVSPGQLSLFDCKPESLLLLPDPWTLPLDEVISKPQQILQTRHKPALLLLPQAKEINIQPLATITTVEQKLDQFLLDTNIDKLQLRPARKIAKALDIAQKVNGRDQKLGFLRSQIKAKLQQSGGLPVETVKVLRELLVS